MCVIAASRSGMPQPSENDLRAMWLHNPDGAGYMVARSGKVYIHKGFMSFDDFIGAVRRERFTDGDSVVYHFRISTQAGKTPEMTHPFPLTSRLPDLEQLDLSCPVGIAHNGIIRITTDFFETRYSDTALFIAHYMSRLIRSENDLHDSRVTDIIRELGGWSKFAIMTGTGEVVTIGNWAESNGYEVSNLNHVPNNDSPFSGKTAIGDFTSANVKKHGSAKHGHSRARRAWNRKNNYREDCKNVHGQF